jgi:two-component system copper resistance phosphate regulon response regulator CusR
MILLVEDDEPIGEITKLGLEEASYPVTWALDGDTGLALALQGGFSLVILDLMLPGKSGFEICTALRAERSSVPILMLTARDSLDDRVRGLDLGADDYLAKPFAFPELLARVRALHRRDKMHRARLICIGDLEIDTAARKVRRAGQDIHLTPHEYTLLVALAGREGSVLTREMIQEQIWMNDSYSNAVDWCVAQLRKKIDANFGSKLIHTVHRVGYRLMCVESDDAP